MNGSSHTALERLSDRQLVGQVLCPALYGDARDGGLTDRYPYPPGAFILFGRGADPAAVRMLIAEHARALPLPPLVFSDMERGAGQQITGLTELPPPMAIAATGRPELARRAGKLTAIEARRGGVHGLFAPVVDVNVEATNPIIATRAFGDSPELIGRFARAFIQGAHEGGGLAVAKHFPGHGETRTDSHVELPRVRADQEALLTVHLPPFSACIEAGVDAIMVGHLACPALGTRAGQPTSQCAAVVTGWLRDRLGFDGLIVTDALDMAGACGDDPPAAALRALIAGADLLLMPADLTAAAERIVAACDAGDVDRRRLLASARRIGSLRERVATSPVPDGPPADGASAAADDTLAREIAEASVTRFGDRPWQPLDTTQPVEILVLDDGGERARTAALRTALSEGGLDLRPAGGDRNGSGCQRLLAVVTRARAGHGRTTLTSEVIDRGHRFLQGGSRRWILAVGGPWSLLPFPREAALLAYGSDRESLRALAKAVTGKLPATGVAPVTLPA